MIVNTKMSIFRYAQPWPSKRHAGQKRMLRPILFLMAVVFAQALQAQVGEHRNVLLLGVNAGCVLSNVGFDPSVPQKMHGGFTGGFSVRYTSEKYFSTICSIAAEVNYASIGWKQDILTPSDQPVVNANGNAEAYERTINYVQIPVFAHLAWGQETKGWSFFFKAGPQIGLYLSESTQRNYTSPNLATDGTGRANTIVKQEDMPVETKFDYGIAAGLGTEWSHPRLGHFQLEARYYYGLGNIYGSSKSDFFGKSNFGNIVVKASYLFDIIKK